MTTCEHVLWILASVLVLAIVAHRREPARPCGGGRRRRAPMETEGYHYQQEYEGTYAAPCRPKLDPAPTTTK